MRFAVIHCRTCLRHVWVPEDKLGINKVENFLGVSKAADTRPRIVTECNVDLRLVNPGAPAPVVVQQFHFTRTCTPQSMGLTGDDAQWRGPFQLNAAQATQVLRIVLDEGLRKLLPLIDALPPKPTNPSAIAATLPTTAPAARSGAGPAHAKLPPNRRLPTPRQRLAHAQGQRRPPTCTPPARSSRPATPADACAHTCPHA